MRTADKQIADILVRYGEPFAGNVWRVQGTAVIYHKTLERIAAHARMRFEPPVMIRCERDEAVILVTGRMPGAKPGQGADDERVEWSIGEALINVNYRVSGRQAAYVYAMAEKRAKDRVILKLIELHGLVYSEEEADEFRQGRPGAIRAVDEDFEGEPPFDEVTEAEADLKRLIDEAATINAVTDLMLAETTQTLLNGMPQGTREEVRDYAKARLKALGWPSGGRKGGEKASAGKAPRSRAA